MAGNTATIDIHAFRADWGSHAPISVLCVKYTVTKDQIIRLRDHWHLPKRLDRSLRWKPKRSEIVDPTPREIAQACREIQAKWDERTRRDRMVGKPSPYTVPSVSIACDQPDEAQDVEDEG